MTLLIATDLDGTLLRDDSTLSDRTRRALRLTRAAGARVVAATARPARVVDALFGGETLLDAAVCGNGAVIYEVGSAHVEIAKPMAVELARWLISEIIQRVPGAGFAVETGHMALYEPAYKFRPTLDYERVQVAGVDELLVGPLVKVMVWLPDEDPDAAWDILRPTVGTAVECTWASPRAPLEISAPGVSKADGLATLCAAWGIAPSEVTAFGDALNDLPMLAWAGTPYAVANADPRVLAATAHHTASNNEDGVALVLERLFG